MKRFNEYYYKNGDTFMVPLWYDLTSINEKGCIESYIPHEVFPILVNNGVIKVKKGNQTFSNMDEAIIFHDEFILEAKRKAQVNPTKTSEVKWVDKDGNERDFEIVADNVKIGSDTIILNMSTAKGCMSAILGLCSLGGECYAMAKEGRFPKAKAVDIRQEEQWACMTPQAIADGIKAIAGASKGIKYVRLNEAGEFRNLPTGKTAAKVPQASKAALADVDDIGKLKTIAGLIPELQFYTYSHRTDLADQLQNLGDNVVINGSGFMLDNAFMPLPLDEYSEIMDGIMSDRFKVVNGEEVTPKQTTECVGDCRVCDKCKVARGMNIYLPIHGVASQKNQALRKMRFKVLNNPSFDKLVSSDMDDTQKLDKIFDMIDVDDQLLLKKLKRITQQKKDFVRDLLSDGESKQRFIDSLEAYVELHAEDLDPEDVAKPPTEKEKQQALAASIDSLMGTFKSNLARAQAEEQKTGEKKWTNLIKSLEDIINKAKKKEPVKIPSKIHSRLRG